MLLRLALALCALALAPARAQEIPLPAETAPALSPAADIYRNAELEKALDAAFATGDFVGLAVAVVRGGDTQFIKTWGVVEAGAGDAVTPGTVFRIGSLSKGFASTLAGMAMLEGKLKPDDPIAPFHPALALAGGAEEKLTVAHILSHRTGLPPNAYDNLLEAGYGVDDILARYKSVKLVCPVGTCYAYQNVAFNLIGGALSSVYGVSYQDLLEQRLFAPLGMTAASADLAGLSESGDFARPHVRDRIVKGAEIYGPWRTVAVKDPYYRVPAAGGVNASILDMAAWLKAQMGRAPGTVSQETLDLIHAPRVVTPAENARMRPVSPRFRGAEYALGWRVYAYEGHHLIAHSGTVEGYGAQIAWLPDEDAGIVILANARTKRLWRILPTFLDIELGLPREDWLMLKPPSDAVGAGQP
jgi:beta-lactamase class C